VSDSGNELSPNETHIFEDVFHNEFMNMVAEEKEMRIKEIIETSMKHLDDDIVIGLFVRIINLVEYFCRMSKEVEKYKPK